MLPNWLYGKSKSKLANILGGGGGTPTDYNQVKAQVNQNTKDIALLNTSNQSLTAQSNSIVNVLGAKNIIPLSIETQTINGVTITVQDDGSIVLNGTATADTYLKLTKNGIPFKSGKCILSGVSGGSASTYCIFTALSGGATLYQEIDGQRTAIASVNGDSAIFDINKMKTASGSSYVDPSEITIRLQILNGLTFNNVVIKPMLRLASITDDTYVPYSKTNKELTDELTVGAVSATANTDYLNGTNNVIFRKYGKMVSCEGYFQVTTAAAKSAVLYTLAELPLSNSYLLALKSTGVYVLLNAKSDGTIIAESEDGIATGFYSLIGNFVLP